MRRRLVTVPGLFVIGVVLVALAPLWLPGTAAVDVLRRRFRFPTVRLLSFAVAWSWIEISGVVVTFVLWVSGRGHRAESYYALQRWWARKLMRALDVVCGIRIVVDNVDALRPGPVLIFARHASLADSLVSAFVIAEMAHMKPRYVLKRELLVDPCLDIVGQRVPNHFLDRSAPDAGPELEALERLVADLDSDSVGIIFPEGTRSNPAKRERALEKISSADPERGRRLSSLRHLLPPRPSGAAAMARGNPDADIVIAWHVGFEGLDTFGGIYAALARRMVPVRFVFRRFERSRVPSVETGSNGSFTKWLDERWLEIDVEVDSALERRRAEDRQGGRNG